MEAQLEKLSGFLAGARALWMRSILGSMGPRSRAGFVSSASLGGGAGGGLELDAFAGLNAPTAKFSASASLGGGAGFDLPDIRRRRDRPERVELVGDDRILVQMPGVENPARLRELLGSPLRARQST